MKLKRTGSIGAALLAAVLCLRPPLAQAGIVTTDQLTARHKTDVERGAIKSFLERASVRDRIQAMGVDGIAAENRVDALNDDEVHALAQKIDSLPAGGDIGGFTNQQIIIVLLLVILVAIIASS